VTRPPLLLVVPQPVSGAASLRGVVLGGLPLLRRIALAAQRAGFERVLVAAPRSGDESLLVGTAAAPLGAALVPASGGRRVVLLADAVAPQAAWLRQLARMPVEPEHLHVDGALVAVVEAADPSWIVAEAATGRPAGEVFAALRRRLKAVEGSLDRTGRFALGGVGDVETADRWLLQSLIKPGETFMSRHFERRLSLALTRRLARTSMTPNAMSVVMIAIGLLGSPCFLSPSPAWQLTGAFLFLVHSILDGCDGELARLKFLESPTGAALDFWGDNIVHSAVFGCLAAGWAFAAGALWPLLLGAVVVGSTLAAAATLHRDAAPLPAPAAGPSAARGAVDALSNRSFIYLIVALAAFGRAWWFLVPAAVGTPIFVALARWARRGQHPA
jgi:1L-myo-inositol 1-phosphate cytidylyltransferase / CDP-L-myo-inositol myo-inositolphosphotransferase